MATVNLAVELERRGKRAPPESERVKLIEDAHLFGHFGRDALFKKLYNSGHWWSNMRHDIDTVLQNCDACVRYVVTKSGYHPASSVTASAPWDHIQIDLAVHLPPSSSGHVALLVIICVFTGFVILRPLKDTTATTVARKLWKVFTVLGLPKIVQSDNGPEFSNEVLRALVKVTGIDNRLILPYNPRADGKIERAIGSVMLIIKKLLHGTNANWPVFAPFAQLTFNDKVATLTGSSPFALMFGRALNPLTDYTSTSTAPVSLDDWKEQQEKILTLIYPAIGDRIRAGKADLTKRLDKHRKVLLPNSIPNGAIVMLKDINRTQKFDPKYVGPYTVIRRARNGGYVLRDGTGDLFDRHVPADQLKLVSRQPRAKDKVDDTFEVEEVVDCRGSVGSYEFLVKWKGYPSSDNTWEPESSFIDTECIKKYWLAHP